MAGLRSSAMERPVYDRLARPDLTAERALGDSRAMIQRRFSAVAGSLLCLASLASPPTCGGGSTAPTPPQTPVTGCATLSVANEGWFHVVEGSAITYRHN